MVSMKPEQIRLLSTMKKLIHEGKRKFQDRNDRNYIDDLNELGIDEEEAWNIIMGLKPQLYYIDPMPTYNQSQKSLTFKRKVNNIEAYIKLELRNNELVVCWSFHNSKG